MAFSDVTALVPDAANSRRAFSVGDVAVSVVGERSGGIDLPLYLKRFEAQIKCGAVTVQIENVAALDAAPGLPLFDSGSVWRLLDTASGLQFDFSAPALGGKPYKRLIAEEDFSHATLLVDRHLLSDFPLMPALDYPLDELLIMHRLTQEKAIELHGAGIVRADGIGNLFVGHSGAGKSTTTRLWTEQEDVEVLSDDRIIVRRDEGKPSAPVGTPFEAGGSTSKHGVLRLRDCSPSGTNRFAQDDKSFNDPPRTKMRMYGTPWHGEAMYASPNSAPLERILILEHGRGNVLTRLSRSQGVAELFARAFVPFHRHEYVESALNFLEELVDAVPVYHYAFEPDQRAVDKIIDFRD